MRSALDTNLVDGFDRAGNVLERNLLGAIRRGSLGFDDLKQAAFSAFDQIAAEALNSGLGSIFGARGGALGEVLSGTIGALFGLPGRATGGPVSPGRGYLVGERGPELFVPSASGTIIPNGAASGGRSGGNISVTMNISTQNADSFRYSKGQIESEMAVAINRAARRTL